MDNIDAYPPKDADAYAPRLRMAVVRDGASDIPRQKVHTPETAAQVMRMYLRNVPDEHGVVLLLDAHSMLVGVLTTGQGSTDFCPASTKNVLRPAIITPATVGIIFGHNHPSGKAAPSAEDLAFFKKLKRAADDQDIRLFDCVIVGDNTTEMYSHRRETFDL